LFDLLDSLVGVVDRISVELDQLRQVLFRLFLLFG